MIQSLLGKSFELGADKMSKLEKQYARTLEPELRDKFLRALAPIVQSSLKYDWDDLWMLLFFSIQGGSGRLRGGKLAGLGAGSRAGRARAEAASQTRFLF